MKDCQLTIPSVIYSGQGTSGKVAEIIQREQAKSVLLFTGKDIRKNGLTKTVEEICQQVNLRVVDDLAAEPSVADVERTIQAAGGKVDLIIAIGGGSVMDAAKLASIIIGADYTLQDLLQDSSRAVKQMKTVMIPTTCGTGSEATCNAIVAIPELETKKGIVSDCMIPDYVLLDVDMIARLPAPILAATAVDALAHVVECYTSKKATVLSDTYALMGAQKIFHNIRKAYKNPEDLEAKLELMVGAFYGGVAITGSGTTAVHALSYPLGGKYHIPHGVSNAILFAHVMAFNKRGCAERLARLCDVVYPKQAGTSVDERADYIIADIANVVQETQIPVSLEKFGVKHEEIDFLVESGSQQTRLLVNNCLELSKADIRSLYEKLF
ncbi:Alcohol dehydrogenase, class IV [Selenomonas ruminantium]|uniref:Alcohol dehydrogenase, class IV n=1 Tax=Selenomonas ruminantium TaxID=971 RepID=A0A1M6TJ86_SELRU|nr:iron-containing alcohol dehydrogenase [Selenomonas ruminantium]SHK56969.1 Alcohol dehydrogenase, class IV [Selenomonas ruminantium]